MYDALFLMAQTAPGDAWVPVINILFHTFEGSLLLFFQP